MKVAIASKVGLSTRLGTREMKSGHAGIRILRPRFEAGLEPQKLSVDIFDSTTDGETIELEQIVIESRTRLKSLEPAPLIEQLVQDQLDHSHRFLILDLGSLQKADSSLVGQLVAAVRLAAEAGGEMVLVNPTPKVREVLGRTQIDRMIPVFAAVDEAVRHFGE